MNRSENAFRSFAHRRHLTICAAITLAAIGCNNSQEDVVDVRGRVTYKGQPVTTGTVRFTPTQVAMGEASSRPVTAVLDSDGAYRMKAFRSRFGMSPGDYAVSILSFEGSMMEPETVKYLVPKKYSDTRTSGLTATVPVDQSGTLELNFDIL
jgi:hypothetical protein